MSRIGKSPIPVPSGVEISIDGVHVSVKGPKGQLAWDTPDDILVNLYGYHLLLTRTDDARRHPALHAMVRSLVATIVVVVSY